MVAAAGRAAQARLKHASRGRLDEPVGERAARLARRHLDAASDAADRLRNGADPEALHDFRVALRRLRSALRAYRPWFADVPKKLRRGLKEVARATGEGRDAEVCLEWLDSQRAAPVAEAAGRQWLHMQLTRTRDAAYAQVRDGVLADFAALAHRLHKALAVGRGRVSYAEATAERLRTHVARLAADLGRVASVADAEALHEARIQAKRLRYLIEPLEESFPGVRAVVRRLKSFQDETGVLCDGFVRRRLLTQAVAAARARQARLAHVHGRDRAVTATEDILPGLLGLARRNEREIETRFARLHRRRLGPRLADFLAPFTLLARRLTAACAP